MSGTICPWWLGGLLAGSWRRLAQDPGRMLRPFVAEGMTVLEPGPGMGFFTLELARLVGPRGRVVAVDIQPRMLEGLSRRAAKAGLADRIETRPATAAGLGVDDLEGRVDFALAFAVVHEVPDPARFLGEIARTLKPGGRLLLAEPGMHVPAKVYEETLRLARAAGLAEEGPRPDIRWSRAAVLAKTAGR